MNRSRFLVPIAGVCVLAALAPRAAHAQGLTNIHSMRQSFQTAGTLSWGGQVQNVRRVRVELDENGDARLKFDAQARDLAWGWRDGDWNNWSPNQEIDGVWVSDTRGIIIDLRKGLGVPTVVGTARLTFDDNFGQPRLRDLTIGGRVARHPWDSLALTGNLSSNTTGGGTLPGGGNTGGPVFNNRLNEFSTIKRGDGQFTDDGRNNDIDRANIQLNRDGTAQIVLSGDSDYTFGGLWRQTSATRIELRIDTFTTGTDRRPFNDPAPRDDEDSLGGGEIQIDGTHLVSLRLSGTRDNRDFDASFEPETDNGNGNGGDIGDGNPDNGGWDGGWLPPAPPPVWNGGGNGRDHGGWNGGGGGNGNGGNGGWNGNGGNGNGNGGWNGNGGNGNNNPRPEPIPDTDLEGAWRGWTGEGLGTIGGGNNGGKKGRLPAPLPQTPSPQTPDPQPPTQEKPRRPTFVDGVRAALRGEKPATQPPAPAPQPPTPPAPAPAPVVVPVPAPIPVSAPVPAPEQPQSKPPAPPRNEDKPKPREDKPKEDKPKAEDKSNDKTDTSSSDDSKAPPRSRVAKPR